MSLRNLRALVIASVGVLVALSGCRDPNSLKPPDPPKDAPMVISFTADKPEANPGATVKLSYEVRNATDLELVDETGAHIELVGDAEKGTATVKPVKTHFYVLRVSGPGGRDSAFVQVAVGEVLKEAFLIAVPPAINGGEKAQLLWSAARNKSAKITGTDGTDVVLSGDSGSLELSPNQTTTYTLTADPGTGGPKITASAQVEVRPVALSLKVNPRAAHVGENIALDWKTAGATHVVISEATFGVLHDTTDATEVAEGTVSWKIPSVLPNSVAVQDGLPLSFKLQAYGSAAEVISTIVVTGAVGSAPTVTSFEIPSYASTGKTFPASWETTDATRVEIYADGLKVFETLPNDLARVAKGTVTLPAPQMSATYELVALNSSGATDSATRNITTVGLPTITSYTLSAGVSLGQAATAAWTTQNASRVTLRTAAGATAYNTSTGSEVSSGTVDISVGQTTSFTLEAWNQAGDMVSQTKTVVTTGNLASVDAGTSLSTVPVTVSYDATASSVGSLSGIPDPTPYVDPGSSNFFDVRSAAGSKTLRFESTINGVAKFDAEQGFAFPFFGRAIRSFYVSVDGLVGFNGLSANGADNVNLDTASVGDVLAPYWDTLELGNGDVRYLIEDNGYPRRLIIQWSDVVRTGDPGSALTFQVQLYETGEFHYVYDTLTGSSVHGESGTIGVKSTTNQFTAQYASNNNAATVGASTELTWFASTSGSGSFTALFPESVAAPFFGKETTTNRYLVVEAPVRVFAKNSVRITEAMPVPETAFAATGQWVELQNMAGYPIDLADLKLSSTGSTTGGFTFPSHVLQPGDVLVVGQSLDPLENDIDTQPGVTMVYADIPLAAASDTLTLSTGNGTLSTFSWSAAPTAGHSVEAGQPYAFTYAGSTTALSCPGTDTFNTAMTAYGTPGKAMTCLPYRVGPTRAAYRDISSTGTPIFADQTLANQYASFSLPAPWTYFGAATGTELTISTEGWIRFGSATTASNVNRTSPSASTAPQGAIAVFWDDGAMNTSADRRSNVYVQRMEAGADPVTPAAHWIVEWHRFTHGGGTDDFNYEMKLFDSGAIEFHYGAMLSTSTYAYGNGNSATIWIEQPGVANVLAIGRSEAVIQPNTAYRFTPVP